MRREMKVKVDIEKGAKTGDRIVLRHHGNQFPGAEPGDLEFLLVLMLLSDTFVLISMTRM